MKNYAIILFILIAITGCGKAEEIATTEAATTATTEKVEEVTTASVTSEMDKAVSEFPADVSQYIESYTSIDLDDVFMVSVELNNDSYMAEVADYITQAVDGLSKKYNEYDIMISYHYEAGWIYTWHSYDNKVGTLIDTSPYGVSEENVSIKKLYELK